MRRQSAALAGVTATARSRNPAARRKSSSRMSKARSGRTHVYSCTPGRPASAARSSPRAKRSRIAGAASLRAKTYASPTSDASPCATKRVRRCARSLRARYQNAPARAAPKAKAKASCGWPAAAAAAPTVENTALPPSRSRARRASVSSRARACPRSTGSMDRCYGTRDAGALLRFSHPGVEDLYGTVDQASLDGQRRDQLEGVVEVAALLEEEALAHGVAEDPRGLLGSRLLRLAIAHELEPDEEAARVDPAEDRMLLLQLLEPIQQVSARLRCLRDDALLLVDVERRVRRRGGDRRRREGGDVRARTPGGQDLVGSDDGRDWESAREPLRDRHQIRHDTIPVAAPHASGAPQAGLDLVVDQQEAELVAELAQPAQVAVARDDVAGARLHRLDEHGRHVGNRARVAERRLLAAKQATHEVQAGLGAVLRLGTDRTPVRVRVRNLRVPCVVRTDWVEEAPHPALGCRGHRAAGRPVVPTVGGEDHRCTRVPARRLDGELDRVCARDAEDDALGTVPRRQARQPRRQLLSRFVGQVEVMDEPLRLLAYRLEDARMPVSQVRD